MSGAVLCLRCGGGTTTARGREMDADIDDGATLGVRIGERAMGAGGAKTSVFVNQANGEESQSSVKLYWRS